MDSVASEESPTVEFAVQHQRPRGDRLLTVGAVLGSICLAATALALILGVRPVIFETGSMAPTIPTGSLGLSRTVPATSVHPGDVVSVIRDDGVRVTHRVTATGEPVGNSVSLTLRGDANSAPDPRTYVITEVQRIVGSTPILGYVAAWLKNPYTLTLQALAVVFLLAVAFAPRRGWRNSPAGQRIVAGTAAATVVALSVSNVHGTGEAHALTGQATATGSVTAGRPANPSFTCTNTVRPLISDTVTVSWPNPPANVTAGYTYKLSFPDLLYDPIPAMTASSLGNPAQYEFSSTIVGALLGLITGDVSVVLTVFAGNFPSAGLSHQIGADVGLPLGIECKPPGTVTGPAGAAALRAAPESADAAPSETAGAEASERAGAEASESSEASEASESTETSETSETSESTDAAESTTTSDTTAPDPADADLPSGGTLSDSGDYLYYQDGTRVTIRNAESGEAEYTATVSSSSDVRWLPGTSTLEITDPDGTVTLVTQDGSRWTETVEEPEAPETPAATSVPVADEPTEP
ncbi:S24/S26 family peptidase [Gordonia amicalis]|uniref:S24/S26 family peptidase n=1 Tax=Gordonia amicalis TaxID=89053 RepID=UPI002952E37E|nr:S24/S26 family peptidase [Gordonia amicalis]MDV7100252.1 S24/S26 family peptidase [Gordonia amicalis]